MTIKTPTPRELTYLITTIISISLVIALLVNYSHTCHRNLFRVPYDPSGDLCYCQSAVTAQSIQEQLLQNDYTVALTDTLTLYKQYVSGSTQYYYPFVLFAGEIASIYRFYKYPSFIPTSSSDGSITLNAYIGMYDIGGIYVPVKTWDKQMHSMRISEFELDRSTPLQLTLQVYYNHSNTHWSFVSVTFNDDCSRPVSSIRGRTGFNDQNNVMGLAFPNGICMYMLWTPYGKTSADINQNITRFCEYNDCNAVIDFAVSTMDLIEQDMKTNVFKTKEPTHCLPDYCMEKQCFGLALFQTLLLCVSTCSAVFVITKFIMFKVYKKKTQESHKQTTRELQTV